MKKRLLVLAHRRELLEQAREKFNQVDPDLSVEIEQAERRASADCKVVVASVPTLGRAGSKRLAALDPEDFYLLVVDEAHHAVAKTYRRIFDHFGLFEPDTRRLLVGFTATPYRGDRGGLGEVFEEIVYSRGLQEMVESRFLCSIGGWRVSSEVDLDGVRVRAGDFVESQLATLVNVSDRNALIVRAGRDLAPGRRTLVFCVNVEHVHSVADAFGQAGVAAAPVWGAMSREERQSVLERFSRGALQVVTNCNVLTEGFDEPRVDCVIMARPTKSRLLYAQMVGRGTRLHPQKRNLIVIDVADNSQRHSLRSLHNLFDLPAKLDLKGTDALAMAQDLRHLSARHPWVDLERLTSPEDVKIAAERIEFFRFDPPEAVAPYTHYSWCGEPDGGYRLNLPDGEALRIRSTLLDHWEVRLTHAFNSSSEVLTRQAELESAIGAADRYVDGHRPQAVQIVDLSATWRDLPPTAKQVEILEKQRIPVPRGLTRGQASWMIGLAFGRPPH